MQYGAALSALFHAAIIVLALVGLPSLLKSQRPEIVPVAVEIVTSDMLERQAALPPKPEPPAPEPPKPEPKKAEPPKPEPPKAAAPTPPPTPAPPPKAPEPAPVSKPAPPPEPVATPEPVPVPEPKPKAKPPEPPKPRVVKPEPPEPEQQVAAKTPPTPAPKRKPKPPQDEFQSLLKNLAKEKQRQEKERPAATAVAKQADPSPRVSPLQARMMAASLSQAVMQQVTPCWSIPAGAKDAADMSVAIRIRLNPDGALGAAPRIEDTARIGNDPFFRAVAESALRALRNPRCMPLKLPYDQYDMWKDITFVFDPKEALGQ